MSETAKTLPTSELRVRLARHETGSTPPVKYFTDHFKGGGGGTSFVDHAFASVHCCLVVTEGKGLTSCLRCLFVSFPVGILGQVWYRFLILAVFFTLLRRGPNMFKSKLIKMLNNTVLSYDVASGSEITPCNKIDKPLVVYRLTGNVMTSIPL